MRTSTNIGDEARMLTLAESALAAAVESLQAAADYCHGAGRYGWNLECERYARRVGLLHDQIEANR